MLEVEGDQGNHDNSEWMPWKMSWAGTVIQASCHQQGAVENVTAPCWWQLFPIAYITVPARDIFHMQMPPTCVRKVSVCFKCQTRSSLILDFTPNSNAELSSYKMLRPTLPPLVFASPGYSGCWPKILSLIMIVSKNTQDARSWQLNIYQNSLQHTTAFPFHVLTDSPHFGVVMPAEI